MTFYSPQLSSIVIPLTDEMHEQAEQNCPSYLSLSESESIYLNTLCIYVVGHYLKRLGYTTAYQTDIMINPVLQSILDVAPIDILVPATEDWREKTQENNKGDRSSAQWCGTLECRRIMASERTMHIPAAAMHDDRVGYVAVQFNHDLSEAQLLGYVAQTDSMDIPLEELRSLFELPDYLGKLTSLSLVATHLTNWLSGIVEKSWINLDSLMGEQLQLNYQTRELGSNHAQDLRATETQPDCIYGKTLHLNTTQRTEQIILITEVTNKSDSEVGINLKICPVAYQIPGSVAAFLPPGLEMLIVDQTGETVMQAQARAENRMIKLGFQAEPGDRFQLQVYLDDTLVIESFLV